MSFKAGFGLSALAAGALFSVGTAHAQEKVTLEYWVYSDFAQGEALKLQQSFIDEFEAKHPGLTINIAGKGDDDLLTGQIAGAASGSGPDVFMNSTSAGASLVQAGALKNIYAEWMAMPDSFRAQFNKDLIAMCTPKPETMYCIPYTGYGSLMFRNLTVLEQAGVDTKAPIKDWADWLSQMEKVKAAGKYGVPDMTQNWASFLNIYSGVAEASEWGADFETKKTLINPEKYAKTAEFFQKLKPFSTGTNINDQATRDLFISNELAFYINGPWVNPPLEQAAKASGLKYDWVMVPGATEGKKAGVQGYEFIGVAPKANSKLAFEFAAFVTEKQQMTRWAAALGRYNSNVESLADPSVSSNPLLAATYESAKTALYNKPPFFLGTFPNSYWSAITDNASAVADGDMKPDEAASELIEQLNEILADG
ncbi:sugar ABC transporter substrate-binding protein [Xaviernesmea oryzae]|uniref:Sugar ABC transporter substrate-binding protein n=1 Tax=Xaviernesmea oryzae TaxID=464029 RepID=A0A1Q9B0U8_9HYPH|nr:extracellular solute-binding protein [Xaviernesmea oryzae]OLP61594.1 sugar ABC transporter substrate-binding protein [Xaviernesmea oryzae]SEL07150.1 carbohydrate ABC transporter substrate-binding protein, CUT1 family (TC 3.A.1.1.-) [Xaviernesmea oryzae]